MISTAWRRSLALLIGLVLFNTALRAQTPDPPLDPPRFTSLNIAAGQEVVVTIRPGGCYDYSLVIPNPRLIINGGVIAMRFRLLDVRNPVIRPCNLPFSNLDGVVAFSTPGNYELRVEADIASYEPESPPFLLATRTVTVGAVQPVPVPLNKPWMLLAFAFSLLLGARVYAKR